MESSTGIFGPIEWAGAALLVIAVFRVGWMFMFGGEPAPDVWRRRWIEVGGIIVVAVLLTVLGLLLG